jgi:hypothetical protein
MTNKRSKEPCSHLEIRKALKIYRPRSILFSLPARHLTRAQRKRKRKNEKKSNDGGRWKEAGRK